MVTTEPMTSDPGEKSSIRPLEWTADTLYLCRERAAIMEFDGKLPRAEAEAKALLEIRELNRGLESVDV